MLTQEELAELRRLEALAEAGPWTSFASCVTGGGYDIHELEGAFYRDCRFGRKESVDFICAIRNAAKELFRLLGQYEEERMLLRGQVRTLDLLSLRSEEAYRLEARRLAEENERLKLRVLSAAGDDLCRLSQEEIKDLSSGKVRIPPKDEFIASCERFHEQIASTDGVLDNCLTLAQMIAENERLKRLTDGLAARCAGQAELIAKQAEKKEGS